MPNQRVGVESLKDSMMTEENVVSKVAELMEALDHVKKYNALARSLKKFVFIVLGSITLFLVLAALIELLRRYTTLGGPALIVVLPLLLLIPLVGVVWGIWFVRRRVNSIKTGKWREELSQGFPSALKILLELDWENIIDEISIVKLSYALYGLLKTVAYGLIIFFAVEIVGNTLVITFFRSTSLSIAFLFGLLSLIIVILAVGRDLLRRYKEIEALNMLLLELRWFSLEFRRFEF